VAASGALATRLGLSGVPVAAETIALHTIFELVRATGARVHLCRLSSAAGVALVRAAKAEGLPVTADVSINSLHLTDVDIGYFNAAMRLSRRCARRATATRCARPWPTARSTRWCPTTTRWPSDEEPAVRRGRARRHRAGAAAEPGPEVGPRTAAALRRTLARVTCEPVRVLGDALGSLASSAGRLVEGGVADVCVFDPAARWSVTPQVLVSHGKYTPFAFEHGGIELPGRVRCTLVAGTVAFEAQPG
jgi:dihydroorotase